PFIFDDALRAADAVPLAPHLLGLADLASADLGRIDEHPKPARRSVHRPQIEALAVGRARLKQRRIMAVRRKLEQARARPGNRRAREDALDGELFLGNAGRWREGEEKRRQSRQAKETHTRLYPGEGRGPAQNKRTAQSAEVQVLRFRLGALPAGDVTADVA